MSKWRASWKEYPFRWVFHCPGPTRTLEGWGNFTTAEIFHDSDANAWLGLAYGAKTREGKRTWKPTWKVCNSLDDAMAFCETVMIEDGIITREP